MKYIKDPIHGGIRLSDLEVEIIDNRYFQRLRKIKQLANAYLVYPSAQHTRFEHSIGVCYLAGKFSKKLGLDEEEVLYARVAGLLHDIGHGPFGHVLEYLLLLYKGKNHEEYAENIIKEHFSETLEKYGISWKKISKIIRGESRDIISKIIGGGEERSIRISLDVDHLDYLKRDNYFTGAEVGDFSISYLIENIVKVKNRVALKRKAIGEIYKIILMRAELGREVYFHRTRLIANEMILKAAYFAIENGLEIEKFWEFGDENFKWEISKYSKYSNEIVKRIDKRDLYKIFKIWKFKDFGVKDEKIKLEYIDEDFYKRMVNMSLREKYEIEEEIAKEVGVDVIIVRTPPLDFNEREIKSNIYIWDGGDLIRFDEIIDYKFLVNINREIAFVGLASDVKFKRRIRDINLKDYV